MQNDCAWHCGGGESYIEHAVSSVLGFAVIGLAPEMPVLFQAKEHVSMDLCAFLHRVDDDEMRVHVAQRHKLCEEERIGDELEAAKLDGSESSKQDARGEEKHELESPSSQSEACQREENQPRELSPPEQKYPSALPDILVSGQAIQFQNPQSPLFEYLPTDEFSVEGTLESMVRFYGQLLCHSSL